MESNSLGVETTAQQKETPDGGLSLSTAASGEQNGTGVTPESAVVSETPSPRAKKKKAWGYKTINLPKEVFADLERIAKTNKLTAAFQVRQWIETAKEKAQTPA